ncbi:MASE3 domain-containing sensor histidine kinase [Anaerosolibacter sp.]|uniref:MASE3 domain-containing sensor histidine kinase n=1 Tax=Anaerosolibacter sp. TaxID=1872527 RepID=UPI0039F0041A
MVIYFFHNLTLIISFVFAGSLVVKYIFNKSHNIKWATLAAAGLGGLLSFFMMVEAFTYNDVIFDLRNVPIFLIAYVFGWPYGLIASLLPALFRVYLGGAYVFHGLFFDILMPMAVGSIFHRGLTNRKYCLWIDYKKILMPYLIIPLTNLTAYLFFLSLPNYQWVKLITFFSIFSVLALFSIAIIINYLKDFYHMTEKLIKSEERYRKLVELSPVGIFVNINGKVSYSNAVFSSILGFDNPEKMIGKNILDFIHDDYKHIVSERVKAIKKGIVGIPMEQKMINAHGETVPVEVTDVSFPYEDNNGILVMVHDIRERKKVEELARKISEEKLIAKAALEYDRLKTDFFSNVSHELRTPLNIILGTIQLVTLDGEEQGQYGVSKKNVHIMKQNCYRLLRLINNLIDITKLDSGFLGFHLKNQDIIRIIEDITLSVAKYIEDKEISLIFDTELEECWMACDGDKIERIILNLLSNAIKFTNPGGHIEVSIYDREERIGIHVKDTGIGIPEDKINIIFQRFRQVDSLMQRKAEGSGIGLSLVKALVDAHGGTIAVESKYGEGTEFMIELPITLVKDEHGDQGESASTTPANVERIQVEFSDIYS